MLLSNRSSQFRQYAASICALLLLVTFGHYYFWTTGSLRRLTSTSAQYNYVSYKNTTKPLVAAPTVTVTAHEVVAPPPHTITIHEFATTISSDPTRPPQVESVPIATSIPQKIWYKSGPKGVSSDAAVWMGTCLERNPYLRREILTDQSGDTYVKALYAHRPEIVSIYLALSVPILKADFLRYLILYAEGGIWSDLDVSCEEIPIEDWIPEQYKKNAGLVVGLEFDSPDWENEENLRCSFASWMIMAKPRSPHLLMVIEDVLQAFIEISEEHKVPISGVTFGMISDVVDVTGPRRLTRSVVKSLELQLKETIGDKNVSGLTEPRLLSDVLILPGNAFAALQNGHPKNQGPAFITHHYAGSWKNDHGGEETSPPPPSTETSEKTSEAEQQESEEAEDKENNNSEEGSQDKDGKD